jgi:hypothetical protein
MKQKGKVGPEDLGVWGDGELVTHWAGRDRRRRGGVGEGPPCQGWRPRGSGGIVGRGPPSSSGGA